MGVSSEQSYRNMNRLLVPLWLVPLGLPCLRLTLIMPMGLLLLPQLLLLLLPLLLLAMQVLLLVMQVVLLLEPQLHMPQQLLDKPIILMLLDPQQLRTTLNMELLDIKLSKPESNRLLLVMLMLLLDKKPSLSLLHHMLLVLHRTSLKPFLLLLQQSLLLLHLMQ